MGSYEEMMLPRCDRCQKSPRDPVDGESRSETPTSGSMILAGRVEFSTLLRYAQQVSCVVSRSESIWCDPAHRSHASPEQAREKLVIVERHPGCYTAVGTCES